MNDYDVMISGGAIAQVAIVSGLTVLAWKFRYLGVSLFSRRLLEHSPCNDLTASVH